MMAVPISAVVGAAIVLLGFVLSTVLLFLAGNVAFTLVSLVPIALTGFVMFHRGRSTQRTHQEASADE